MGLSHFFTIIGMIFENNSWVIYRELWNGQIPVWTKKISVAGYFLTLIAHSTISDTWNHSVRDITIDS